MQNYFLAYSYLNAKRRPLSDYYDSINFITVNTLNCFIKFNLVFSVIHSVINYHLISILTSINHNLKKHHFIPLVRFHLIKFTSFLLTYLGKDFVIHRGMKIRWKKKIFPVSIHDIQMPKSLQKVTVKGRSLY